MKRYFRGLLIALVGFFLGQALWRNWQVVAATQISATGAGLLLLALVVCLIAHTIAGAVWADILNLFPVSAPRLWGIRTYLTTNLAKYLPGNVWHFYGRFNACKQRDMSAGVALLGILLEPILMAIAALLIMIGLAPFSAMPINLAIAVIGLLITLSLIHPHILNRLIQTASKAKRRRLELSLDDIPQLQTYPWRSLLGELLFVILRGTGFILTVYAVRSIPPAQIPMFYSSFSLAWVLGLVIPGLPGGIGLFEMVMIGLMRSQLLEGELLVIVALYRLVNTLAEAIGAGVAPFYPVAHSRFR
jgi:glycosyltransferase 2 family protein